MGILEFIKYFDLIKPSFSEIAESSKSITPDIASEILEDYDLKITSMDIYDDEILDLIGNTNISDLYFSPIRFYRNLEHGSIFKIGQVVEKGDLFLDTRAKEVVFNGYYDSDELLNDLLRYSVIQSDFLKFFLKYLELDFNRIFKRNNKKINFTKGILLDVRQLKKIPVFEELLLEIGSTFGDL